MYTRHSPLVTAPHALLNPHAVQCVSTLFVSFVYFVVSKILAVLPTHRRSAHADEKWRCAHFEQRARLLRLVENHMQYFTCFADALAFRGRSLVLRKARRILAFLVLQL